MVRWGGETRLEGVSEGTGNARVNGDLFAALWAGVVGNVWGNVNNLASHDWSGA